VLVSSSVFLFSSAYFLNITSHFSQVSKFSELRTGVPPDVFVSTFLAIPPEQVTPQGVSPPFYAISLLTFFRCNFRDDRPPGSFLLFFFPNLRSSGRPSHPKFSGPLDFYRVARPGAALPLSAAASLHGAGPREGPSLFSSCG